MAKNGNKTDLQRYKKVILEFWVKQPEDILKSLNINVHSGSRHTMF